MLIVSSAYKKPVYSFFERRRILYDEKLNTEEYYFGRHHWKKENRWIQGKLQVPLYPGYGGYMTYEEYDMGNIYGKSLHGIKNRMFQQTGFREYAKAKKYLDPVSFFKTVKQKPYLERLIKAKLYHLAEDIMDNNVQIYCEDSGELGRALGIDRFRLKRLRANNGGEIFLQWLLLEKAQNKLICDDVILWMCREKLKPADLMFIMDRMNPLQIRNYLEKQALESGESVKNLIKTWKDYLDMAIRVGVNVQDSVIYRARKLIQRHNEMIKEIEAKDLILRAGELEKKYPGLTKEKRAFEFRGKEYKNFTECCLAYGLKPKSVSSAVFKAKRPHADVMEEIISHMEGCMPKEVTKKEEIPENQVMSKERHRAKEAFFYEGNKYISLGQCCEFYGINESSVRSRAWRKKCTWEEAVKYYIQKKETETPKMQFFYKGKRYKSVSACCAEYGVNASSVRNRAKTTECSIEESLDHFIKKARMETQPSVFIFRDKTYRSLEECCLEYGVNADSVSSRKYRLNCTMEESLEHFIENKDMIAERIQKFTFKGIEYRSLRACCQKYGIDDICVRQRARDKNCSLEESFTHFMTRKRKKC